MKELAKVFRALSDETRLKIYKLILEKPDICVCEIMEVLKMSQTRISRNLAILKNAGLVESRRDAIWMRYSVSQENKAAQDIIRAVRKHVKIRSGSSNC
jgi:ArsR family transcriptional regulator